MTFHYYDYLLLQTPESLAVGSFIVVFAVSFYVLSKVIRRNAGIVLIISIVISLIVAWRLFTERFYGYESSIGALVLLLVILFFLRLIWAFIRNIFASGKHIRDKTFSYK